MDVYIDRKVKVKFEMDENEFFALRDVVSLGQEYAAAEGMHLQESRIKVIEKIEETFKEIR